MAYDEVLADRIRSVIRTEDTVSEKRMFGGLAFLVNGHLAVRAASRGGLLLRVGPAETDSLLQQEGVARFEMRGRAMAGWLHVAPTATSTDDDLARWVRAGIAYAGALPPVPS